MTTNKTKQTKKTHRKTTKNAEIVLANVSIYFKENVNDAGSTGVTDFLTNFKNLIFRGYLWPCL